MLFAGFFRSGSRFKHVGNVTHRKITITVTRCIKPTVYALSSPAVGAVPVLATIERLVKTKNKSAPIPENSEYIAHERLPTFKKYRVNTKVATGNPRKKKAEKKL